jgi:uncharacterized protein (DUF1778 family)
VRSVTILEASQRIAPTRIETSSALLACETDVDHVLRLLDRPPATHLDIVAHPR